MMGTITKIHPPKASRNGESFIRLEFKLEDGRWAKTDICPQFRNYENWKDKMVLFTPLENLILKSDNEVNADSKPIWLTL